MTQSEIKTKIADLKRRASSKGIVAIPSAVAALEKMIKALELQLEEPDEHPEGDEGGGGKTPKLAKNTGNRPSPTAHAGHLPEGTKAEGNDGKMYIVKTNSIGVKQWKKSGDPVPAKPAAPAKAKAKAKPEAKKQEKPAPPDNGGKEEEGYNCDELIEKVKASRKKREEYKKKHANDPVKTQATKNVEAIEKVAEKVVVNVEKRADKGGTATEKGGVSVNEIKKLIEEYKQAIAKLEAILAKAEATPSMAKGGLMTGDDMKALVKQANKIKSDHCGCGCSLGSKMAKGGKVESFNTWYSKYKNDDLVKQNYSNYKAMIESEPQENVLSFHEWAKQQYELGFL